MKIKALTITAALVLSGAIGVVAAAPTYAETQCPPGSVHAGETIGGDKIKTLAECNLADNDNDLMDTINTIINVAIAVIGIVAVVVIILGGVTYVLSQGEAAKIKKAKDTILYGVIGLVVALLAFAIVNFVLKSVFTSSSSGSGGGEGGEGGEEGGEGGTGYYLGSETA